MKLYVTILAAVLVAKVIEYSALSVLEWRTRRKLARAYEAKRSEIASLADKAWARSTEAGRYYGRSAEAHDQGLD